MKIIVGLGNPGSQYECTRHNAGFLALDRLANRLNASFDRSNFEGLCAETRWAGEKLLLLKPQTFMNLSGQALAAAMNFYKVEPEDVLILFDDMDLLPGEIRVRRSGSAGGHNGIKSIIACCGTEKIARVKIGTGHPVVGDVTSFVLQKLHGENFAELLATAARAAEAAEYWLANGISATMNVYNQKKTAPCKAAADVIAEKSEE